MLLIIHNLPPFTRYSDVKKLLQEKCSLSEVILDNMHPVGNTQRVTVGVLTEVDAAILVRKINGIYMQGQQLYVESVNKKKEEQPFRPSSMPEKVPPHMFQKEAEQSYPNQLRMQQGYPYMGQQRTPILPMLNYSMMAYCRPPMQEPNYIGYLNQAFIPRMQILSEIPAMQEQFKTNNLNQGLSGCQHQPFGWDYARAQTNSFQDHADKNDLNRRRIPPSQRLPDQYNSAEYNDCGRKRWPLGGLEFERNGQIGSRFSKTVSYVNNKQKGMLLQPPVPRPPELEKTVFRSEWFSPPVLYGRNPRGPGSRTQLANSVSHEQRAPRFEEPRNRKNNFINGQRSRPREEHQGNFGSGIKINRYNLVPVKVKKEQEAAKAAAVSKVPTVDVDDKQPVIPVPATQDLSGEPAVAPVPTTPSEKVALVPAEKLPKEDGITVSINPLKTTGGGPKTKSRTRETSASRVRQRALTKKMRIKI